MSEDRRQIANIELRIYNGRGRRHNSAGNWQKADIFYTESLLYAASCMLSAGSWILTPFSLLYAPCAMLYASSEINQFSPKHCHCLSTEVYPVSLDFYPDNTTTG
jgi:hypothetical protein